MEEYHDSAYRSRRLAIAREAALANSGSAMDSVTLEDLLIYTRWLVCHMHSVKRINSFLRVRKDMNCWLSIVFRKILNLEVTGRRG